MEPLILHFFPWVPRVLQLFRQIWAVSHRVQETKEVLIYKVLTSKCFICLSLDIQIPRCSPFFISIFFLLPQWWSQVASQQQLCQGWYVTPFSTPQDTTVRGTPLICASVSYPHVSSGWRNTQISQSASKTESKRKLLKEGEEVLGWAVFVCCCFF